jgi:hypothetical protein
MDNRDYPTGDLPRFSGGVRAYTNVFQPVRPDARPAFGRVGSVGLARWPHIGPADSSERRNIEIIRRLRWELCGRLDVA